MQEEVENRTVNLAISMTRLTTRTIVSGIRMYLQHQRNVALKKPVKDDALQQIADSLMAKQLNAEKKPGILTLLEKLKALVASLPNKVRRREQEHSR